MPVLPLRDLCVMPGIAMYFEVGRKELIDCLERVIRTEEQQVLILTQKNSVSKSEDSQIEEFFDRGTVAEVKQITHLRDGQTIRVTMIGLRRAVPKTLATVDGVLMAEVELLDRLSASAPEEQQMAMAEEIRRLFYTYGEVTGKVGMAKVNSIIAGEDLETMLYEIATCMSVNYEIKQNFLEFDDIEKLYGAICSALDREIYEKRLQEEIDSRVRERINEDQKEYYLREEIKLLRKELGEEDSASEADKMLERLEKLKAPKKIKKAIREEIQRFARNGSHSSESSVSRGYVETLLQMPWKKMSRENKDLLHAGEILDRDHYGLQKVKERILECLAIRNLKPDSASPIICLVGPPGTGKTSIARSVAQAMNRQYVRICLGGVRDEAEIRGHRRTYVGAMPGRIAVGLKNAGVKNPVMVLDEIDKVGSDGRGDPAAALLEVLDPEQNKNFSDHYIELPLDLTQVLFICTANTLDTVPRPLIDRMEVIEVSGYTQNEKFHIAKDHLWKKQLENTGLKKSQLTISDKALWRVILNYTRESGVRGLEKQLGRLCRKAARRIVTEGAVKLRISDRNLEEYLGKPLYLLNMANARPEVGVVRGLAWTSSGGDTLEIEAALFPGKGELVLTGKLGDVMKESAQIALSVAKAYLGEQVEEGYFRKWDLHIHVPEGATPKDGPSAGVTMATAIYSAVSGKKVRADMAMTGEITLRGRVLPIGGLKEKLLAAKTAGIKLVMVPEKNQKDVNELEEEILEGLEIKYARYIQDIWKEAFV